MLTVLLLPVLSGRAAEPSSTSLIGDTVTNPVTALTTTVTGLMKDPAGTPTAGATAFVQTADGYAFLVKAVGEIVYNNDSPAVGFKILSKDTSAKTVTLQLASDGSAPTATLSYQLLNSDLQAQFMGAETPGVVTPPVIVSGASGVKMVSTGNGGSNGRNGALFVPPTAGGDGDDGPAVSYTNTINVNTSNKIGIEVGSVGGDGGKGGNSYASFWSGRDGGDGGAGGPVTVMNNAGIQVATTGDNMHGIFAYSRSGQAGDGGSGYAAPGGGTGGHSADGGSVTVTNNGTISTTGAGAFGIYGLSVSNNGGNGGDAWGLVGVSGDGSYGGNGGPVIITNSGTGNIFTSGNFAHGILAQSIGGSGGSSGISGNLLLSLNGSADNGGNGGSVTVNNGGAITTTGIGARGIFAQSVGGGGGSAGTNVGLVLALGGSGSNGGNGSTVTVRNYGTGQIITQGAGSDGIFAQSVGGSGGSGSNSFGLVAVGGSGSKGGNGGMVTVENLGTISTQGNGARGIVAQSIGGGGGDGGSSGGMVSVGGSGSGGGTGAAVTVLQGGSITTQGNDARGILAQSVGGGGGNGGSAGSLSAFAGLAIGGNGGAGGAGGTVGVTLQGNGGDPSLIRTYGDRSTGLFAQSVGGGGGSGGGAVQVTGGYLGALSIAIGGQGGSGGAGGTVSLTKGAGNSNVWTDGIDSTGISLQSVGGGGGTGGFAVAVALSGGEVATSLSVGIGGSGGNGGAGGSVTAGSFNASNALISTGFDGSIITHGDTSTGFLAQSVGGGGGNGGLSVSVAGSGALIFSGSIAVGVGGSGGDGGAGGLVRVGTQGNITTTGSHSTALLAQSIGGGGGNGGGSIAASAAGGVGGAGSFSLGIGGKASNGSAGGQVVLVTRAGTISTSGENSIGILAQSIGGGGGNGGYTVTAGGAGAMLGAGAVNIGIGGSAGGGGAASSVIADLQSNVFTSSINSAGIVVQSIGGGGGNGGFSVVSGGSGAAFGSGAVGVGVGGSGGAGGIGGAVQATSTGIITTFGDNSAGFMAQSIGGGGGNGGFDVTVSGSGSILGSGAFSLSVGGSGGSGNHGGTVVAETNAGAILTNGNDSIGVLAQSIGGGGGNGGFSVSVAGSGAAGGSGGVDVGVGGSGSSGGNANSVHLTVSNAVTTRGKRSSAVVAQSLGGGGGNGGFNVNIAGSGAGIGSGTLSVGVGGFGAGGGTGGDVTVLVTGNLDASLDGSGGLLAQSIGGGGGNGGFDVSLSGSGAGVGSGAVSFGMGGFGGAGGNAGVVNATSNGTIITRGHDASGFLAQSIGGGGGNGGFNVSLAGSGAGTGSGAVTIGLGGFGAAGGNGGNVTGLVTGNVTTLGNRSTAVTAQSIGGGGGNGGFNADLAGTGAGTGSGSLSVGLGGFAAGGGDAGDVSLVVNGILDTTLDGSGGLLAQSIGGGGGNGGFNVTLSGSGAGAGSGAVALGLGGFGGSGGAAGLVNATSTGRITTRGHDSSGFTAQSIGGGGGNGGFNISLAASGAGTGSGAVTIGLGGFGGGGGNAGNVIGSTSADILTVGNRSMGILTQSIGGGGGNGGFNISLAATGAGTGSGAVTIGLGGFGAAAGNAGTVGLTVANNVSTNGNDAAAIVAQSIGGGGGNGGFNISGAISGAGTGSGAVGIGVGGMGGGGGIGSTVTTGVTGIVSTQGSGSGGVISQSLGGGGGNGGFSVAGSVSFAGTGSGAVSLGIGGFGGDGGNAGLVASTFDGSIYTVGDNSLGLAAQSIGGGGGNGGLNVSGAISGAGTGSGAVGLGVGGMGGGGGNASAVTTGATGMVVTQGNGSGGVISQSLGGGGGNGGISVVGDVSFAGSGSGAVSLGVGGFAGNGGNAGLVTSTFDGSIYTAGDSSLGLAAQSIGGGGGYGGLSISGSISLSKSVAGALALGIGGAGGGGGNAGNVNNSVTGFVQTTGAYSPGVIAQSLGGGGGNGGLNVSGTITASQSGSAGLALGVGGFGGDGGLAGNVVNNVIGGVITNGNYSDAILGQSIGGSGGNGAVNVSGSLNLSKENGAALALGLGGFGGGGGNAGSVTGTIATTTLNNLIGTIGDYSSAVVAQSLGGGGGNGGLNVTGAVNLTGKNGAAVGLGLGGFGGSGGNGALVDLDIIGPIITYGDLSHGVMAQSIGGGGGNGGIDVTGAISVSKGGSGGTTAGVSLGVGGFGGGGGTAGPVNVDFDGMIYAQTGTYTPASGGAPASFLRDDGPGSHGLAAQSIGGGGGNGGLNVSAGLAYAGGEANGYGILVGVGGFGGAGGSADAVSVNVTGGQSITGYGAGHSAILAQSVGGGGGNGGINVTGGVVSDANLFVGVGGFAGDAGTAGNVIVNAVTDVFAEARDSLQLSSGGVMAQSIGGGGGNGGLNVTGGITIDKGTVPAVNLGIGGFGGSGASSGNVTVNLTGNARTSGDWIHGVMAQSIAGGGGNGGINATGSLNFAASDATGGKTDISVNAGIGGSAGDGANAGNVVVTHTGVVTTSGNYALGVAGQSIGGGGGTGGMNIGAIFTQKSSPITVGVGGSGGTGGNAGSVSISRGVSTAWAGNITTDGIGAHAIDASSIGGGGGNAGMNLNVGFSKAGSGEGSAGFAANILIGGSGASSGNGNTVLVDNFSHIETKQDGAYGILAQSIGGGGGCASFNVGVTYAGSNKNNMGLNVAIGGGTGEGGTGGLVTVNQTGDLLTAGRDAIGILAQSIGGGGGNAGLDFGYNVVDGASASVTIGRRGGTGGDGGNVNLSYLGTLLTQGDGAFGLLAQSLGNGGGNSTSISVSGSVPGDNGSSHSAGLAIGLEGGEGGRGGNVLLNSNGIITTNGIRAHAVFAQSIGGGGGNGGMANNLGLTPAVASLSIGGTGGTGGIGGNVTVNNTAVIHTNNEEAVGILAQSIGGGGGTGGMATNGSLKSGDSGISVGVGGTGGTGLTGGTVTVDNSSIVITDGLAAHALLAQSIGGGGGNGGMAVSAIVLPPKSGSDTAVTRVAINVGGSGGEGGNGGAVNVTNTGGLGTYQAGSVGLFAQSIGGGGGNAGTVVTGTVVGKDGNNFALAIGGAGGTGGTGGAVTVKNQKTANPNSAMIITADDYAHGILAMSVGGGGGNGSDVFTFNSPGFSSSGSATYMGLSIGGSGGTGGTGGLVDVLNEGLIETHGSEAHGIIAQSIGGGGGNGGMAITGDLAFGSGSSGSSGTSLEISIGGFGGDGNAGGKVNVTNSGTIEVFGDKSYGILAQSVGGGGGDGGFAASFSRNLLTNPKQNLGASLMTFALGGIGGSGGDSGDVYVNNSGNITAHGDNAYGIFAQSVSGGGGNSSLSFSSPVWMAANLLLDTITGGTGSNGTAGTVTIDTTGNITMLGSNSIAQFGQSVNGGGGNVNQFLDFSQQAAKLGDNGLPLPGPEGDFDKAIALVSSVVQMGANFATNVAAKALNAMHLGNLFASGDDSSGGFLQSLGGGGGRGNQDISIAEGSQIDLDVRLGGKGVSNSSGGDVTYTQIGDVELHGGQGAGIEVQSIGGGGGTQIITLHTVSDPSTTSFSVPMLLAAPTLLAPPPPPAVTATIGGDAVINSNGGNVNLTFSGASVTTTGDRLPGLLVQSIGGSGGRFDLLGASALNIDIGGKNGTSGNGGNIDIQHNRAIITNGTLSHGMLIQSIGGGGGVAFTDLDPSLINVTLNTTNSGNGGNLTVTQTGNVTVQGPRSTGIILQSIGGGGGLIDDLFSGTAGGNGRSGSIDLVLNGSVSASGPGGTGVFVQSAGTTGQGNIAVTLAGGQSITAGPGGTGVRFGGGAENTLLNNGSIGGADGIAAWAVRGTDGGETIQNNGILTGQVDLGAGTNAFSNNLGGTLNLGPQFLLGNPANRLLNDGTLRPGGTGLAQRTDMTGRFVQSFTGVNFTELDFLTNQIDQIYLNGAASLNGRLDVTLLNPQKVPSGHFQKVVVNATGGVTNDGMALTAPLSQVLVFQLLYPDANNAVLDYDVDFSTHGKMGRNLNEVGNYINRIQAAGSSEELEDTVIRLLYEPTFLGYKALLSQLGPDFYAEQQGEMIRGSLRFGEVMLAGCGWRCSDPSGRRRWWVDVSNSNSFHDSFGDYKAVRQEGFGIATGIDQDWREAWTVGIAAGFEDNSASGYDGHWYASGSTQRVGVSLRRKFAAIQIAGLLNYGWNEMNTNRWGQVTTPFGSDADRQLETLNAMVRVSREITHDSFYCKPMFDVGYSRLLADDAAEINAGPTILLLQSDEEDHAWLRPAIEVGAIVPIDEKVLLRLRGSVGYQRFVTGEETTAAAKFIGAPEEVAPMDVPVEIGSMIRFTLGADLLFPNDSCIGVQYTKSTGDQYDMDQFNVRISIPF